MQNRDTLANFEIYIPKEAEVKIISLWSLPVSTLRRMGLPSSTCGSARKRSHPSATWISPVVIRERVCSPAKPSTAGTATEKITSLVTQEETSASGPYIMPFITSNCTAFKVLGDFLPSSQNPKQQMPAGTNIIPCGKPPIPHQDAVIIHQRRVYLSIKKTKLVRGPAEKLRSCLNSTASSSLQTTQRHLISPPLVDSKSQESCPVPPDCSASNSKMKTLLQRFGVTRYIRVTLPSLSQEDLKSCWATVQDHGSTVQDHGMREATQYADHEQSEQGGANDLSRLPTGGVEEIKPTGRAGVETFSGDDTEMEDPPTANSPSALIDCPLPFTHAMGQRHTFDFEQLAREETIDRIRAKLRASEAALNNLPR